MSGVESVVIRDVLAVVGVIVLMAILMAIAAGVHYVSVVPEARRLHEVLRATRRDGVRAARLEQRRR